MFAPIFNIDPESNYHYQKELREHKERLENVETSKVVDLEDCEYCGNTSDIVDSRGCCSGCGAKRKRREKKVFPSMRVEYAYGVNAVCDSTDSSPYWIAST